MFPWPGKKHKQHQHLIKLLQTRAAPVNGDISTIAKPHGVNRLYTDVVSKYISIEPQTDVINHFGQPRT